jgi:hypothetical protein
MVNSVIDSGAWALCYIKEEAIFKLFVFLFYTRSWLILKGWCHEMVVEVRPWSGRLALN